MHLFYKIRNLQIIYFLFLGEPALPARGDFACVAFRVLGEVGDRGDLGAPRGDFGFGRFGRIASINILLTAPTFFSFG